MENRKKETAGIIIRAAVAMILFVIAIVNYDKLSGLNVEALLSQFDSTGVIVAVVLALYFVKGLIFVLPASVIYVAVGVIPIWHIIKNLQLRGDFYCFTPLFKIEQSPTDNNKAVYGQFMRNPEFMGEITIAYNLPFASISTFANYYSYPKKNWNFGISLGILMYNPKFVE